MVDFYWANEASGLAGDMLIDVLKRQTVYAEETPSDEHIYGPMNPWHTNDGSTTWLPVLYRDTCGQVQVDWAW